MDIRTANVTMEVYTLILLGALMLSQLLRRKRNREIHLFFWMLFAYLLAVGGDLIAWIWSDADTPAGILLQNIGNMVAYLFGFVSYPLYASYLFTLLRVRYRPNRASAFWAHLILLISVVGIVLTLSNPWTHLYYSIDGGGVWTEGPLVLFHDMAVAAQLLIVIFSVWLMREVEIVPKIRVTVFCSMTILGALMDFVSRDLTLIYPLTAIAFLYCYVNLQLRIEHDKDAAETALAQARTDFLLGQVKPHLIFNTLNTIYHLCGRDVKTAQWAIGEFSDFLRQNMDSFTLREPIGFTRELEHVRHYANLEQLRFGERVRFVYDTPVTDFLIPPVTVLPLVENAVTHGISKKEEGGCVTIRTRETEDAYRVIVEDDGAGCDLQKLEETIGRESGSKTQTGEEQDAQGRPHVGIMNTKERLLLYHGSELTLESRAEGGLRAIITIPKKSVEKVKTF